MLLGAVTWGPACAALHVAADWLQPRALARSFLIAQGLLDDPDRPAPQRVRGSDERPWRERRDEEQGAAAAAAQQQRRPAQQAAAAGSSLQQQDPQQHQQQQQQQEGTGPRRTRSWWGRVREVAPQEESGEEALSFEELPKRRQVGRRARRAAGSTASIVCAQPAVAAV
jgi:hypothetical protein